MMPGYNAMTPEARPARIVVFTCGRLGLAAADLIAELDGVGSVMVVVTPYRARRRTGMRRLRHAIRYRGLRGVLRLAADRVRRPAGQRSERRANGLPPMRADSPIRVLEFEDFHDAACIAAVTGLAPDLGVVVGTYILEPSVYTVPRLGSINLHTGKAPEYRGSAPAFWEMYNAEDAVGITIHRVSDDLDAGEIVRQELVPIDPAPNGDPLAFIRRYREQVLHPRGIQLLAEAVRDIVGGTVESVPQDSRAACTYRLPTHRQKQELRRRVARRRRAG